jgi:hypothetical protein
MTKRFLFFGAVLFLASLCVVSPAYAMEQGHYVPGSTGMRDYIMPDPGWYFGGYNSFYVSDTFAGQNGKKVKELGSDALFNYMGFEVDPGDGGDFEMKAFQYSTSPTFAWVTPFKVFGGDLGFAVSPTFGYIKGKVKIGDIEVEQSDYGQGDLYVQPAWLGWGGDHYDISAAYGFFAPTGRYDNDRLANMGMGFWSHDFILNTAFYPDKEKATAFVLNTTYEFSTYKKEIDVRPGDVLCLEYGISQMLGKHWEVGVEGYSVWQVTNDSGSDARAKNVKDYSNAVGGELSYSMFHDKLSISGQYLYEYAVKERLKGHVFALNVCYSF